MNDPDNNAVAAVFGEMAELLDIRGGDRYRARTFARISRLIAELDEPVRTALEHGNLATRRGVGEGTTARIKEILRTGTCKDLTRLRAKLPSGVRELLKIRGLGPKTVRLIHTYLRVASVQELEHAARTGRLAEVPRLGPRAGDRILKAIERYYNQIGRTPLGEALRLGSELVEGMRGAAVDQIALTGSARRFRDTIGDLDILVASNDAKLVTARFLTLPQVSDVLVHGDTRTSVLLEGGQQVDLRVVLPETFGAGLHYFTGSKAHNIAIRIRGNRRKLKISEHGIFRRIDDVRLLAGTHEEEVFAAVGLPFIPPELRENEGELEAAERGKLPQLVAISDLRGDLNVHTIDSDGAATARAMAEAALAIGLEYVAICDHANASANGLDGRALLDQVDHIHRLQEELGIHILAGVDVAIAPDGALGLDTEVLAQLDWVMASVDTALDQSADDMTARIIGAMESGLVDCIGHPLNRILGQREAVALDHRRLFKAASRLGVALELNSDPRRLDLDALSCREARGVGARVVVSSAAHNPHQLAQRALGVCVARRGWLEPGDVLNTRTVDDILAWRRARMRRHSITVPPPRPIAQLEPGGHEVAARDEASALQIELTVAPLSDSLCDRLHSWLRDGEDPPLAAALAGLDENPVQKAFELLLSCPSPGDG